MIVLVGASASGKTQIATLLFRCYGYEKCITTTTRSPREKEVNGVDYHFVDKETFKEFEKQEAFIEVTEYQANFYGIQKKDIHPMGVVIVDPHGANALIEKLNNDVFVVFVYANDALREERMIKRGDDIKLIEQRLQQDQRLFIPSNIKRIDLFVDNNEKRLRELAKNVHKMYRASLEE